MAAAKEIPENIKAMVEPLLRKELDSAEAKAVRLTERAEENEQRIKKYKEDLLSIGVDVEKERAAQGKLV